MTNISRAPTTCSTMPMACTIVRHGSRAGRSSGFDSPPRLSVSEGGRGLVGVDRVGPLRRTSLAAISRSSSRQARAVKRIARDGRASGARADPGTGWRSLLLGDGTDGVEDLHLLRREVLPQVRLGHLAEGVDVDVIDDLDGAVGLPAGQDLLLGRGGAFRLLRPSPPRRRRSGLPAAPGSARSRPRR